SFSVGPAAAASRQFIDASGGSSSNSPVTRTSFVTNSETARGFPPATVVPKIVGSSDEANTSNFSPLSARSIAAVFISNPVEDFGNHASAPMETPSPLPLRLQFRQSSTTAPFSLRLSIVDRMMSRFTTIRKGHLRSVIGTAAPEVLDELFDNWG